MIGSVPIVRAAVLGLYDVFDAIGAAITPDSSGGYAKLKPLARKRLSL